MPEAEAVQEELKDGAESIEAQSVKEAEKEIDGHDVESNSKDGHDKDGHDKDGHDKDGHDKDGHDIDGHDRRKRRDVHAVEKAPEAKEMAPAAHVEAADPTVATSAKKKEGEACGPCFNPSINNDCGSCEDGLECVKEPTNPPIPDAPGKCKKPKENSEGSNSQMTNEQHAAAGSAPAADSYQAPATGDKADAAQN